MRVSSKRIHEIICNTFNENGINVISIGLASTPQLYFATCTQTSEIECDLGIIITASHNPKEYNGMKICKQNAIPISYDTGLNEVERRILEKDYDLDTSSSGTLEEISIQNKYEQHLLAYLSKINDKQRDEPMKIVIDYANAIGCHSNKRLISQLEKDGFIKCIHLFDELDGTFPNHEANPIKEENLIELKKKVIENNYDFGISFDGDSDRIGFVNNKGEYLSPDIVGCFLVEHLAKCETNFTTFCYDLRSTHSLLDIAKKYDLKTKKTRVGHSHIKADMHEINAQFSCELSAHFYFEQSYSKYDDALRALLEVIVAYSYENSPIHEVMDKYITTLKNLEMNFKVDNVKSKIEESKTWFNEFKLLSTDTLDGITYEFEEFWINIRSSNTEPLIRVNFEVLDKDNQELYYNIINILEKKLK